MKGHAATADWAFAQLSGGALPKKGPRNLCLAKLFMCDAHGRGTMHFCWY